MQTRLGTLRDPYTYPSNIPPNYYLVIHPGSMYGPIKYFLYRRQPAVNAIGRKKTKPRVSMCQRLLKWFTQSMH